MSPKISWPASKEAREAGEQEGEDYASGRKEEIVEQCGKRKSNVDCFRDLAGVESVDNPSAQPPHWDGVKAGSEREQALNEAYDEGWRAGFAVNEIIYLVLIGRKVYQCKPVDTIKVKEILHNVWWKFREFYEQDPQSRVQVFHSPALDQYVVEQFTAVNEIALSTIHGEK